MTTEIRTYDDVAQVAQVMRYSPAERAGLLTGDLILGFGLHAPSEILAAPDLAAALKKTDWLFVLRGDVAFRLSPGEGLVGAHFEASTAAENVRVPAGHDWPLYWGGVQSTGAMVLVPDAISPLWAILPPLLSARFRNWQMLAAIALVWATGLAGGLVTFALAYLVSVAAVLFGGTSLMRDASQKQGYLPRGLYRIASLRDVAALEIATAQRVKAHRAPAPPAPKAQAGLAH